MAYSRYAATSSRLKPIFKTLGTSRPKPVSGDILSGIIVPTQLVFPGTWKIAIKSHNLSIFLHKTIHIFPLQRDKHGLVVVVMVCVRVTARGVHQMVISHLSHHPPARFSSVSRRTANNVSPVYSVFIHPFLLHIL